MRLGTLRKKFVSTLGVIVLATAATAIPAQEARVGNLDGHAAAGKKEYRRYCIGCHGPDGDGMGENAQWIEPKPRDFTEAVFKCRSTPTGTLPTDDDLYHSIERGFASTNMPSWLPLTGQVRANLVAYIKTFSPRWSQGHGTPIVIPPETPTTVESMLRGRALFQKMECWKCHGPTGHGDGPAASALTDSKDNRIMPHNFSDGSRFKCGQTNEDLYRVFMTGVDGTPMPSFADNLKPDEAWDLVHFLRTLQPLKTPEAATWQSWLSTHANTLTPIGPPTQ
jgi:mono/diheme cytochrome c family protein